MKEFPGLQGTEVEVLGVSENQGSKDIVLSSAGWVMVSPRRNETCRFIAYTPGGKGVAVRAPFLPYSVNQRGRRIAGSPAYRNDRYCLAELEV